MKTPITTRLRRLDAPIHYRTLTVRHPVCTLALLFFVLLHDGTGLARLSLAAALWHESGHLLAYRAVQHTWPPLHLTLTGFCLAAYPLGKKQDIWVTLCGPAANLAACGGLWALAQYRAGYGLYACAAVNLCMGLFNLLPLPPLDGQRLWRLMWD